MTSTLQDISDFPTASIPALHEPSAPQPAAHLAAAPDTRRNLPKSVNAFLAIPRIVTWLGLIVVAVGIVLITIGWGDVAGTEDVGDQLPYVMSAGFGGLAAVCIGVTIVAIDAKLSDAAARRAQAAELREALADLALVEAASR